MRYLVSCFLVLPLLTSCTVVEERYYGPGYYAPPPPRVEVHPIQPRRDFNNNHGHYQQTNGVRPVPGGRVYHGHTNTAPRPVVVNPQVRPSVQAPVQQQVPVQQNVHGHSAPQGSTVHGHGETSSNPAAIPPQANNAAENHGHAPIASQQPSAAPVEVQGTVHGHG